MLRKTIGLAGGLTLALLSGALVTATAGDWPQWGRDGSRNMVGEAKNLPVPFKPGTVNMDTEQVDMSTTEHVKWVAKLGSQSYGNVSIGQGRILLGTNNAFPRDKKYVGDRAVVLCLDEKDGSLIWQLNLPKLGAGKVSDWEYLGICSSPAIVGERVFVVSNLGTVICLDLLGLANGNQGLTNEGEIVGTKEKPIKQGPQDADIIWQYDMRGELGVFPHNITSSSVLPCGDVLFVNTSNGVDWSHVNIPSPRAPCLIALDIKTGKLLGEEVAGISSRIMHCSWSSPAAGKVGKETQVIFGAGDGFCYGFSPKPVQGEDGLGELKELWRFDCVPPEYKTRDGKPIKYASPPGPSEIIASPVLHDGKVYVAIGQDPEHGEGVGKLSCIDASGRGDITKSGELWSYKGINRSISTVSVADGLVYAADYAGKLHCLDAKTGKVQWTHDTQGHIWSSTLVADGKVFLGNEDGFLTVMQAGPKKKVLAEIEFNSALHSSPVVANDVLYIQTMTHLYAISKDAGGAKNGAKNSAKPADKSGQ